MVTVVILLAVILFFSFIIRSGKNEQKLKNVINSLTKENNELKSLVKDDQNAIGKNIPQNNNFANELPALFNEKVFLEIYGLMENTNNSLFITGKAGTGKSTLIDYFKTKTKKNTVYLAPTGVAALNIRGKTIHSFFKFPHEVVTSDLIEKTNYKERDIELFKNVNTVIIDEISMVRADIVQGIDYVLKKYRNKYEPFGGVQMIFIGDMYQLPPVVDKKEITILHKGKTVFNGHITDYFQLKYGGPYFFNSDAFKNSLFLFYELETVFRQKDNDFISLLNSIRENKVNENTLDTLNRQYGESADGNEGNKIMLCTRKGAAQDRNKFMLGKLKTPPAVFEADLSGSFLKMNPNDYPAEKRLTLKEGAQVMMLVNDKEEKWVNGTIGKITGLSENKITVEINGIRYGVNKHAWETIDYVYDRDLDALMTNITGTFLQYPLMLAWAITVHKSQGKTFDSVEIDLGSGAFAHGQTYVALSRCKTLKGITLKRPVRRKDIIVDAEVTAFIKDMNKRLEYRPAADGRGVPDPGSF